MRALDIANVYYWLGYLISDVEQIDGCERVRGVVYELRDAINDLLLDKKEKKGDEE